MMPTKGEPMYGKPDMTEQEREIMERYSYSGDSYRMKIEAMIRAKQQAMSRPKPDPTAPIRAALEQSKATSATLNQQLTTLMEAIRKDLASIRTGCTCDCPDGVPASDCPKNTMAQTMAALVSITLDNMKG